MDSIAFVITSAPYGREEAFRGIYLSFATVSKHVITFLLLLGDGVYSALKDQRGKIIEYPDVSQLVQNILAMEGRAYASRSSCEVRGIKKDELIEGVELASDIRLAWILVRTEGSIVF